MRLLHAGGFSEQERKQWRVVIFNNLIQSFQIVLREMEDLARTSGTTSEDTQVEDPASMEERLPYVLVLRNSENQVSLNISRCLQDKLSFELQSSNHPVSATR